MALLLNLGEQVEEEQAQMVFGQTIPSTLPWALATTATVKFYQVLVLILEVRGTLTFPRSTATAQPFLAVTILKEEPILYQPEVVDLDKLISVVPLVESSPILVLIPV